MKLAAQISLISMVLVIAQVFITSNANAYPGEGSFSCMVIKSQNKAIEGIAVGTSFDFEVGILNYGNLSSEGTIVFSRDKSYSAMGDYYSHSFSFEIWNQIPLVVDFYGTEGGVLALQAPPAYQKIPVASFTCVKK